MFVSAIQAQVKRSPSSQARKRMAQAVDKTLQEGLHAKLPPHLSTLLGLSREEESLVRQGVLRSGRIVQGFDVATGNKDDIVLFVVDEATNEQTLYLTSLQGLLRKVVTVRQLRGRWPRLRHEKADTKNDRRGCKP
jgi:hypothetical protein